MAGSYEPAPPKGSLQGAFECCLLSLASPNCNQLAKCAPPVLGTAPVKPLPTCFLLCRGLEWQCLQWPLAADVGTCNDRPLVNKSSTNLHHDGGRQARQPGFQAESLATSCLDISRRRLEGYISVYSLNLDPIASVQG